VVVQRGRGEGNNWKRLDGSLLEPRGLPRKSQLANGPALQNGALVVYLRISKYTGSPKTILVICRKDPVNDIKRPPKDA
jgi:hypothetical protein